jgi:hypothetical protein
MFGAATLLEVQNVMQDTAATAHAAFVKGEGNPRAVLPPKAAGRRLGDGQGQWAPSRVGLPVVWEE